MTLPDGLARRSHFFWTLVFICLAAPNASPSDTVLRCHQCFQEKRAGLIHKIKRIEALFIRSRWMEDKIRRLYYKHIWEARHLIQDPLSGEKRDQGKELELHFKDLLREAEAQSLEATSGIQELTQELQNAHLVLAPCAKVYLYDECIQQSMDGLILLLDNFEEDFTRIYETERVYRSEIQQASAGRDGMYLDDILEDPMTHVDPYWRFEAEREETQFRDNQTVLDFLINLETYLSWNFSGENCCYAHA